MKICNLAPALKEVFAVSKLDRLLPNYDREDAALAAF
jgi:hypothetical protein